MFTSELFDEKMEGLFAAIGGEYTPPLDDDEVEIILTLESGQAIRLSETENEQLEILASLGPVPNEPTSLVALLIANRNAEQQHPTSFFITPDAAEACAVLQLPLTASTDDVVDSFQRIVHSCNWYLKELLATSESQNTQSQSQIKV
ncbi:hypothetical protein H0A36_07175 [Endozoicomonas sp. SM1973]|uniref:Type III secretion system chaperone n=1 Tax=Spartinivicinus marinus TaxID=2994442 RepID=A0A853I7A0_9GAMM|nr:hypothetical protein [Spartinivicinus marinus]MCX4025798.1 hypothetical protein [Spartinivicinus marinus]NYZ65791.1 hypothetical protein [Spartinivicinus marinus]